MTISKQAVAIDWRGRQGRPWQAETQNQRVVLSAVNTDSYTADQNMTQSNRPSKLHVDLYSASS